MPAQLTNKAVVDAWIDWVADAGYVSNENTFPQRLILFWLKAARSRLIKERLDKGTLSQFNYQTIPCIPLEEVDQAECPCVPNSGCTFLKTAYAIPKALYISSVTSLLGNIRYNYAGWDKMQFKTKSRKAVIRSKAYYSLKNIGDSTYLYLYNDNHKKKISVTGIFEDPLAVQCLPETNKAGELVTNCCADFWQQEFVIDGDLVSLMYDLAMATMMRYKSNRTDAFHNDEDDTINHQTTIK